MPESQEAKADAVKEGDKDAKIDVKPAKEGEEEEDHKEEEGEDHKEGEEKEGEHHEEEEHSDEEGEHEEHEGHNEHEEEGEGVGFPLPNVVFFSGFMFMLLLDQVCFLKVLPKNGEQPEKVEITQAKDVEIEMNTDRPLVNEPVELDKPNEPQEANKQNEAFEGG